MPYCLTNGVLFKYLNCFSAGKTLRHLICTSPDRTYTLVPYNKKLKTRLFAIFALHEMDILQNKSSKIADNKEATSSDLNCNFLKNLRHVVVFVDEIYKRTNLVLCETSNERAEVYLRKVQEKR